MFPENKKRRGKSLPAELNNKLKFRKEGQKFIHTTINSGEVTKLWRQRMTLPMCQAEESSDLKGRSKQWELLPVPWLFPLAFP